MFDLDELERLEREATPGQWHWKHNDIVQRDEAGKFVADVAGMYCDDDGYPNWGSDNAANTELIIALRNAAPALFAELRTLRARVAELERDLDACRVELLEAQHAVGEAWFAGGATLAEAIERKCRALEDEVEGWELAARGWP